MVNTSTRSDAPELMDDFAMEGEVLRDALDKIARINHLLGGNHVTLEGVKQLLKHSPPEKKVTILDVGCGNGDMLRTLADCAKSVDRRFELLGIDANQFTINHARHLSSAYPNISYRCVNIFDELKKEQSFDIVLCTLTLHHFKDEEIRSLLTAFAKCTRRGFIINDLHRSAIAYYLFQAICFLFGLNKMSRDDGLVSILRGFKKQDLLVFSQQLNFRNYSIKWKWAFRYQWIVKSYG